MKKSYKTLFLSLLIAGYSCSKNNSEPVPETPPVSGGTTNNLVFYADTFRIYSTAFGGASRKLVVDEDIKSGNNYIMKMTPVPGKGIVAYSYTTGYLDATVIKTVKADGSDKKIIKTMAVGTQISFLKGIMDGKIYYGTNTNTGGLISSRKYVMDADGNNEKELTGLPGYGAYLSDTQISNQGLGILGSEGYFAKLKNGVFDEANSFQAFSNETKADIYRIALSDDATKVALLYKTSAPDKYEVRVKDNTRNAAKATTVYTVTLEANTSFDLVDLLWVNGTKNILFYNGKFTFPKGAAADFTKCELIDVEKGTATNWKFTGDQIGKIVVD
jgi:hypothetical protein